MSIINQLIIIVLTNVAVKAVIAEIEDIDPSTLIFSMLSWKNFFTQSNVYELCMYGQWVTLNCLLAANSQSGVEPPNPQTSL